MDVPEFIPKEVTNPPVLPDQQRSVHTQLLDRLASRVSAPQTWYEAADAFDVIGEKCNLQELAVFTNLFTTKAAEPTRASESFRIIKSLARIIERDQQENKDPFSDTQNDQAIQNILYSLTYQNIDWRSSLIGRDNIELYLGILSANYPHIDKYIKPAMSSVNMSLLESFDKLYTEIEDTSAKRTLQKILNKPVLDRTPQLVADFISTYPYLDEMEALFEGLLKNDDLDVAREKQVLDINNVELSSLYSIFHKYQGLFIQLEPGEELDTFITRFSDFTKKSTDDGKKESTHEAYEKFNSGIFSKDFQSQAIYLPEIGVVKIFYEKNQDANPDRLFEATTSAFLHLKDKLPEDYFGNAKNRKTYRFIGTPDIKTPYASPINISSLVYAVISNPDSAKQMTDIFHEETHLIAPYARLPLINEGLAITAEEIAYEGFEEAYGPEGPFQALILDHQESTLLTSPSDLLQIRHFEEMSKLSPESNNYGLEHYIFGFALIKELRAMEEVVSEDTRKMWKAKDPGIELANRSNNYNNLLKMYITYSGDNISVENEKQALHEMIRDMGFTGDIQDRNSLFYQLFERVTEKITTLPK